MYLLDDMWQHMSYHIGQFDQILKQNPQFSRFFFFFPIEKKLDQNFLPLSVTTYLLVQNLLSF
jgi:hypothetical protein